MGPARLDDGTAQAGGDDERGSRIHGDVDLGWGEHRSGADEHSAAGGESSDRRGRGARPEGHLGDREPTVGECLRDAEALGGGLRGDHGNDRVLGETSKDFVQENLRWLPCVPKWNPMIILLEILPRVATAHGPDRQRRPRVEQNHEDPRPRVQHHLSEDADLRLRHPGGAGADSAIRSRRARPRRPRRGGHLHPAHRPRP
ncbi:conserved hypothetical protein [Pseudoclavibacter sp. 8L]|nr:conserved hypothetical protein [Pseudoclavibacter sp. 8L]